MITKQTHLEIEDPLFHGRPHVWIQWKGTDVCCDVHCACGAHLHWDGDFMYFIQCPHCDQYWEVGTHIALYPLRKEDVDPEDGRIARPART